MHIYTNMYMYVYMFIRNAQAQSATVPCRLSCGQCSDGRFVLNTCIVDMSLMCVACVSQSSFIQRRSHDYVCRMCFAKFFHSEMQSYTYTSLNTPLRSGLVSRSLVARPCCNIFEFAQSLEATRELDVSCWRPGAAQK